MARLQNTVAIELLHSVVQDGTSEPNPIGMPAATGEGKASTHTITAGDTRCLAGYRGGGRGRRLDIWVPCASYILIEERGYMTVIMVDHGRPADGSVSHCQRLNDPKLG